MTRSARQRRLVAAAACALIFAGAVAGWPMLTDGADSAQIAAGRALYAKHCTACHSSRLEGQPNWQQRLPNGRMPAPPHDASGHTWHHSDAALFTITKEGVGALVPGYQSDMPAFGGVIADDEIGAVVAFIKSTWPRREHEYQAARTKAQWSSEN